MPDPLIYKAAELASIESPVKPLAGNRRSAQAYCDRITRSDWWAKNCPGFWDFEDQPPRRVWIWYVEDDTVGGMLDTTVTELHSETLPSVVLGSGIAIQDPVPAVADKWVILHELAHVMTNLTEGHHGKDFCLAYIQLVHRWLGPAQSMSLTYWCKKLNMRLNYRLAKSLTSC